MGVTLSIRDVPEDVVARLESRAEQLNRSLESELRAILIDTVGEEQPERMSVSEILADIRARGISSLDESVAMIRKDRDRAEGRR